MHGAKYIQKNLIERFSEKNTAEESAHPILLDAKEANPMHLSQFFKTAEHRKRQMLEKMLMD